jgi:deoxyribodipyrimidine photo-lyase
LNFEITQTYNPSYFELINRLEVYENTLVHPVPRFLDDPENLCPSFSKFWQQVTSKNSYPRP